MFICSLRPKAIVKKLLFLAVIAAAVFLLLTLLKISSRQENDSGSIPQASQTHETEAPNNLARITFLKSYGLGGQRGAERGGVGGDPPNLRGCL